MPRKPRQSPPESPADGATPAAKRPPRKKAAAEPKVVSVEAVEPEAEKESEPGDEVEEVVLDPSADAFADVEETPDSKAIVPVAKAGLAKADRQGLTAPDLLQRYMAEVTRYPLLTREQELDLSRRYVATQDPKLAYKLVTANLRLVVKIAWEYRRAAFNLLDLIQEGNVGLMQGVKKYDPERNVKLSSYAAWWIRAYIIRYLMDNWRMVKLGTTQAQRKIFFNLRKEKEKLAAQGFEPDTKLLAQRMNVTEEDVIDMDKRLSNDEFSLDTPMSDDSATTFGDRLPSSGRAIDDTLADEEIGTAFKAQLVEFAKTLADKERFIYEKRLIADEPMTLQEIGDHYGISRERARQIEARLTGKLKEHMREHLPDFDELSLQPRDE